MVAGSVGVGFSVDAACVGNSVERGAPVADVGTECGDRREQRCRKADGSVGVGTCISHIMWR